MAACKTSSSNVLKKQIQMKRTCPFIQSTRVNDMSQALPGLGEHGRSGFESLGASGPVKETGMSNEG